MSGGVKPIPLHSTTTFRRTMNSARRCWLVSYTTPAATTTACTRRLSLLPPDAMHSAVLSHRLSFCLLHSWTVPTSSSTYDHDFFTIWQLHDSTFRTPNFVSIFQRHDLHFWWSWRTFEGHFQQSLSGFRVTRSLSNSWAFCFLRAINCVIQSYYEANMQSSRKAPSQMARIISLIRTHKLSPAFSAIRVPAANTAVVKASIKYIFTKELFTTGSLQQRNHQNTMFTPNNCTIHDSSLWGYKGYATRCGQTRTRDRHDLPTMSQTHSTQLKAGNSHLARSWGDPLRIFRHCQKAKSWGYQMVYISRSCFRCARHNTACDRQTDTLLSQKPRYA